MKKRIRLLRPTNLVRRNLCRVPRQSKALSANEVQRDPA